MRLKTLGEMRDGKRMIKTRKKDKIILEDITYLMIQDIGLGDYIEDLKKKEEKYKKQGYISLVIEHSYNFVLGGTESFLYGYKRKNDD